MSRILQTQRKQPEPTPHINQNPNAVLRRKRNTNPNSDAALNPSFLPSGEPVPSADLPAVVMRLQDGDNRVLLSISGKDSLAAWLFLREHDFRVIPYFCYSAPGLSYDDEWIEYLQDKFETKIYRFLHPASNNLLSAFCYQTPERVGTIARIGLIKYDFAFLESEIRIAECLPGTTFSAVGIRAKDNLMSSSGADHS